MDRRDGSKGADAGGRRRRPKHRFFFPPSVGFALYPQPKK